MPPMLCIAHRGASFEFPENTLPAFDRALELGAEGIECDLQPSRDGQLMVIHDPTLQRTTAGRGRVLDQTAEQLVALGVPTLEQLLELAEGRCLLNLELKGEGSGRRLGLLAATRRSAGIPPQNWLVSSFSRQELEDFREQEEEVPLGWLCKHLDGAELKMAQELGVWSVHPGWEGLTLQQVRSAISWGFAVIPFTLDLPDQWQHAAAWGCHGVFSNDVSGLLGWR